MRFRVLAGVFAAFALIFGATAAQSAPSLLTLANMSNDGPADNGDNEVDIAINPTNGSNMIAGWNDYGPGVSCGVGWTTDGGKTWHTDWLRGMTPAGGNPTYDYGAGRSVSRFPERRDSDLHLQRMEHEEADRDLRHDFEDRGPHLGSAAEGRRRGHEGRQPRPSDDDDRPLQQPGADRLQRVERSSGQFVRARLRLDRHIVVRSLPNCRRLQVELTRHLRRVARGRSGWDDLCDLRRVAARPGVERAGGRRQPATSR